MNFYFNHEQKKNMEENQDYPDSEDLGEIVFEGKTYRIIDKPAKKQYISIEDNVYCFIICVESGKYINNNPDVYRLLKIPVYTMDFRLHLEKENWAKANIALTEKI